MAALIWTFLPFGGVTELADTHSLWLNFTVKEQRYEVQCSVDGKLFLHYDNINGAKALGPPGKEVNGTEHLVDTLTHMGEEFTKKLSNIEGQRIVQVGVFYQLEGERQESFLQFTTNGQHHFNCYPVNKTWSENNTEARKIINKCENNKGLLNDIPFMIADYFDWLQTFLNHLPTTPGSPDISQAPTTTLPPSTKPGAFNPWLIFIIIIIIIAGFIITVCVKISRKRDQRSQPDEEGQRSCCHNYLRDERGQCRVLHCIAGLFRDAENRRETTEPQREEQGGRLLQDTEGSNVRSLGDEAISTLVEDATSPAAGEISISMDSAKFFAYGNGGCL